MASSIIYEELFRLKVEHPAFPNYKGLRLLPTPQTQKLFKAVRMKYKALETGGLLFFQTNVEGGAPTVTLPVNTMLTFTLEAKNKNEFMQKTDYEFGSMPSEEKRTKMILFQVDNNLNTTTHILTEKPKTKLFNYEFKISGNPTDVDLKVVNTSLYIEGLTPINGIYRQQLDFQNQPDGKYTVEVFYEDPPGNVLKKEEEIYVDDFLAAKGIIGLVEIKMDSSFYTNTITKEFELLLKELVTPP